MNRVTWIDMIKGYAMLMVLMVHIDFVPDIYMRIIEPVFLSAFFFASGYTFSVRRPFGEFFINKVRTLLVPFIIFGFLNISLSQVITLSKQDSFGVQLYNFFMQIRGKGDELWFLACIFVTSIVFYFIVKYVNNVKMFMILIVLLSILSVTYTKFGGKPLPWHIHLIGISCFYMGLGYLYRNYMERASEFVINSKDFACVISILYLIYVVVNWFALGDEVVSFNSYGRYSLYYYMFSIVALAMAISVCKVTKQFEFIQFIGRNSLIYFAFHGKIERVLMTLFYKVIDIIEVSNTAQTILEYVVPVVIVGITALILILFAKFINRYLYFLIGRKQSV